MISGRGVLSCALALCAVAAPAAAAPLSPACSPPLLVPAPAAGDAATRTRAEAALARPIRTVTDKTAIPPSGDRHDYMSIGPYWWPDPHDPIAPWVRRDGQVNPARDTDAYDRRSLGTMAGSVDALARGWAATGDRRYADRAAAWIRAWFLAPATRMNPNLDYAQAIPGRVTGRGEGVLDGAGFHQLLDAVVLLDGSGALTIDERGGLSAWFARYLDWLRTSRNGRDEAAAANNHGLWYDSQLIHVALFVGRSDLARGTVEAFPDRIEPQMAIDGSLPRELARTRSFHYSLYALTAAYNVADLGRCVGTDLYEWRGKAGRSLQRATDYVAAYRGRAAAWPRPELAWPAAELDALLVRADRVWPGRYPARDPA